MSDHKPTIPEIFFGLPSKIIYLFALLLVFVVVFAGGSFIWAISNGYNVNVGGVLIATREPDPVKNCKQAAEAILSVQALIRAQIAAYEQTIEKTNDRINEWYKQYLAELRKEHERLNAPPR